MSDKLKPCPFCGGYDIKHFKNALYYICQNPKCHANVICQMWNVRPNEDVLNERCKDKDDEIELLKKEYHSVSDRSQTPKQESDLSKEDIADYKKAKKRLDDMFDPILSMDDFKKEIYLVDETMGKLVIEQDEPKPEAKEDEIDKILFTLYKDLCDDDCKTCTSNKRVNGETCTGRGYGLIKQAREELAHYILNNSSPMDDAAEIAELIRGKSEAKALVRGKK